MAEIFHVVRVATLVLCCIVFVVSVLGLTDTLASNFQQKTQSIVAQIIVLGVTFLGAWGSYFNNRVFLYVFAIIVLIATLVGSLAVSYYTSIGVNIILVILAVSQAELLRRGYA